MNPHQNKKRQTEIKNLLMRYRSQLLRFKNVKDLGVGFKFVNNVLTEELSIIIEVSKKEIPDHIALDQLLPKQIEGVALDIIESPAPEKLFFERNEVHPEILKISDQRNQFYEELLGGIWIRNKHRRGAGGTLGAVVYDRNNGDAYGITSRHVLFPKHSFVLRKKVAVIQPNTGSLSQATIGKALINNHEGPDCIRFQLNDHRSIHEHSQVMGIAGMITGIEKEIVCGAKVMKSGARTGVTYGIIVCESICNEGFIVYPDEDYDLIDGELSMPGDSGAIWLTNDEQMKAVGLHWLGNRRKYVDAELSVALKMERVAEYLNIRF